MLSFRAKLPISFSLTRLFPLLLPGTVLMLADSILSYSVPIYAQHLFTSDLLAGLVISFSSIVGLSFDYVSKRLFGQKSFAYFIKATFSLSVLFSYVLGLAFVNRYFFIFAMAIWGIYYETLAFANFKYLKHYIDPKSYTMSWGFISMVKALIYGTGPLLATFLLSRELQLPAYLCGTFVLAMFFVYLALFSREPTTLKVSPEVSALRPELRIWLVLFRRIYPIWFLNLILITIDSGFWTVGILMSETVGKSFPLAKLFLPMYMLPAVIFSPLSQALSIKIGKKRTAICASLVGSVFLIAMGVAHTVEVILLAVFAYSVFVSLAFPAIYATFEDYISRLKNFDTDLIGLEQSSTSLAYIVGPILAGFLAVQLTEQKVFFVFGAMLALTSLIALVVTPRKIKMPQTELLNTG